MALIARRRGISEKDWKRLVQVYGRKGAYELVTKFGKLALWVLPPKGMKVGKLGSPEDKELPETFYKSWGEFAYKLLEAKIDPAEHKDEFLEEWELSLKYLPQDEALKMAGVLAREIKAKAVPPPPAVRPPPPAVPVPPEGLDKLIWELNTGRITYDQYERKVRELRK